MACEKCWSDAFGLMMSGEFETQSEAYQHLLQMREDCTPEEICGVGSTEAHTVQAGRTSCACGFKSVPPSTEESK